MFSAFSERDYRNFWITQFISNIGSWMQTVAQGWLVYRLTDSAYLLGFVGFASSIPTLFLMLPGGVVADHVDRRRIVSVSQWAQALSALFLAVAIYTKQINVWQIIAASFVVGIAISFSAPAWQAMVVDLLDDRERLPNAIAMNSLQFNLSRALGPLLAGVTLAAWGSFWCFFFNAISFLPLIFVLGRVKKRQQPLAATGAVLTRLADGFRYVRTQRIVILLLGVVAAVSLFGYAWITLMPMVARALYGHNDAHGLAVLMAGTGVGALCGSMLLTAGIPPPRVIVRTIVAGAAALALGLAAAGYARLQPLVIALLFVCGAAAVYTVALCNTSIQQRIADNMRGRVLSMYTFAFFAFTPFGNLFGGMTAERWGYSITFAAMGGALLLSALCLLLFLRQ
ncbi:MAG TPA: MFS transporter [Thermoanaerobaculia bacterium]|nr:MFS transporter [Thermoanaerobaculia bacterium]